MFDPTSPILKIYFHVKNTVNRPTVAVFLVFVYYLFSRLYLIWKYGYRAFGYDVGIYRHHISGYFDRLGDATVPPFAFSHFSNALLILKDSPNAILFGWYFLISVGSGVFLYILVKKWFGATAAILAIFLFSTSATQFEFYQWYYYRNLLAVFFLLLLLYLFEYRSYLLILPLVVIGSIHPPSFIPIVLSLAVYAIFKKEDRKYLVWSLIISLATVMILNWRELVGYLNYLTVADGVVPLWQNYLAPASSEFTGQFIDFEFFWQAGLLYIPFAIVGAVFVWRRIPLILALGAINSLLIIIGLVLYRRYFVYLDIILIIFAAGWIGGMFGGISKGLAGKILLAIFIGLSVGRSIYQIVAFQPLLVAEELAAIQEMENLPKNEYVMALSAYYAPWLYGFSNHEVIAPGMFEANQWTEEEWRQFWSTNDRTARKKLFKKYDKQDIYIFMGNRDRWQKEQFMIDTDFTPISQYLWKYRL